MIETDRENENKTKPEKKPYFVDSELTWGESRNSSASYRETDVGFPKQQATEKGSRLSAQSTSSLYKFHIVTQKPVISDYLTLWNWAASFFT